MSEGCFYLIVFNEKSCTKICMIAIPTTNFNCKTTRIFFYLFIKLLEQLQHKTVKTCFHQS